MHCGAPVVGYLIPGSGPGLEGTKDVVDMKASSFMMLMDSRDMTLKICGLLKKIINAGNIEHVTKVSFQCFPCLK